MPYNAADKATPPKAPKSDPNYFQPDEIAAIWEALETEPLHGKEYRLATYLGAKAVKIKDSEVIVRQGRLCLTVKRLGSPGHPLQAPVGGAMTRTIHEHPSCKVYYRFTDGDVTLLELEAPNAAFEYEY